jgi:uncharacterized membrane protein
MRKLFKILARMLAVFFASALSVLGVGAIVGIQLWQSLLMAGALGVARVLEGIARAYIGDGKLTDLEIEEVFQKAAARKKS